MPREVSERAHALLSGDWQPPPLRDATTVVLLRDRPDGLETYLMRRMSTMAFAAGMHVFPGGRIDDADISAAVSWTGTSVDADRMTASAERGRGLVVCAVRELFEETGVLLAVDSEGRLPVEDDEWERDRSAVHDSSAALAEILDRRGLSLDPGLLPLWSHWVTPEIEAKRYDVRFFVAAIPAGQDVRDVSGEADHVRWIRPAHALDAYARGDLAMLPPTVATIADLLPFANAEATLASAPERFVCPLMPRPLLTSDGDIAWEVVDLRTGRPVMSLAGEPAGSEEHGTGPATGAP